MFNKILKFFGAGKINNNFGIIGPDEKDDRDYIYADNVSNTTIHNTLAAGDTTEKKLEFCLDKSMIGKILNQGSTSSCTGHCGAYLTNIMVSKTLGIGKDYKINPYYIYYYARKESGLSTDIDSGAYVRSTMKALQKYGGCFCEMSGPRSTPPKNLTGFKIKDYFRIPVTGILGELGTAEKMKYALYAEHLPILISFNVIPDDISNYSGIISGKKIDRKSSGWHCVIVIGFKYINDELYFIIANSWGSVNGDSGYYYIHEDYFTSSSLVSDVWTCTYNYF